MITNPVTTAAALILKRGVVDQKSMLGSVNLHVIESESEEEESEH
jgi:hypothetical protein